MFKNVNDYGIIFAFSQSLYLFFSCNIMTKNFMEINGFFSDVFNDVSQKIMTTGIRA